MHGANTFTFTTPTGTDIQIFVMKGSASGSTTIFSIDDVVISEYVPGPAEISSRNTFDTGTENWIGGSYDAVGKRLYVSTSTQYSGVSLPISTVTDGDYIIAFDVDLSLNPSDYVYAEIFDQTTTPWAHLATVVLVQGNNAFRLTAPTPSLFMNVLKGSASGTLTQFYIDNVVITGPPAVPQIVSSRALGSRSYELGNHLGNVVAVITDKKTPLGSTTVTGYLADVNSTTDYYAFGSPQPGRNFNSPNYRYGFNGQEKDDEINGDGNGYEFRFRGYDARYGRFWNVDPVHGKYPWNSPYIFAENDVISSIDIEGLEKYKVITRHFIPEASVFGGFFRGDYRGFTTKLNVTSRINQLFTIDTYQKKITDIRTYSDFTRLQFCSDGTCLTIEETATPKAEYKIANPNGSTNNDHNYSFSSTYSASDPLAFGMAPDIDFTGNYGFTKTNEKLVVSVNLNGDPFPAVESFISDEAGNSVFIGAAAYDGTILSSYGKGKGNLFESFLRINLDEKGNFKSVFNIMEDKEYSIEDWNKKFEQKDATKKESKLQD